MSNLPKEIGSLSAAEKFELLDALWESIEADAPPLTDAQRAELDHRVATCLAAYGDARYQKWIWPIA